VEEDGGLQGPFVRRPLLKTKKMSKIKSFYISATIAVLISLLFLVNNDFTLKKVSLDMATPFLIYWYMIWKLFHDKNKD